MNTKMSPIQQLRCTEPKTIRGKNNHDFMLRGYKPNGTKRKSGDDNASLKRAKSEFDDKQ